MVWREKYARRHVRMIHSDRREEETHLLAIEIRVGGIPKSGYGVARGGAHRSFYRRNSNRRNEPTWRANCAKPQLNHHVGPCEGVTQYGHRNIVALSPVVARSSKNTIEHKMMKSEYPTSHEKASVITYDVKVMGLARRIVSSWYPSFRRSWKSKL